MYRMKSIESVNTLEHLAISMNFMTPELQDYIAQQREYFRPRTPQELRHEFDHLRRHHYTENELMRGVDEMNSDRMEGLRRYLLTECAEVMGDYLQEFGCIKLSGPRSDVWSYPIPYEDIEMFFEVWLEYVEGGILVRCRRLESGMNTLLCGTSYEVPV